MKDFKKFIISVLSVIAIVFIVDWGLGFILDRNAVFIDQAKYKRITNAKEDLVVLGASRAQNQYVTTIIEDSLNLSAYNYGVGAQNVYSNYAVLDMLINKSPSKPKMVIWDFYYTDIQDSPGWNTEKITSLYTAYNYDELIKEVVNLQGNKKRIMLSYINLYKFNSKLPRVIKPEQCEEAGGYSPLFFVNNEPITTVKSDRTNIDKQKINYINKFIDLCVDNDVKLFVFISPAFYRIGSIDSGDWANVIEAICYERTIPFYNYEQNELFLEHPEWFFNMIHLNDTGAKEYTYRVVEDVKDYLNKHSIVK